MENLKALIKINNKIVYFFGFSPVTGVLNPTVYKKRTNEALDLLETHAEGHHTKFIL